MPPRAKIDVDYHALLEAADDDLWGVATHGEVHDMEEAVAWLRRVMAEYGAGARVVARDLEWSDAWRQRLHRAIKDPDQAAHMAALLLALADGLLDRYMEERGEQDARESLAPPPIMGVGEESMIRRLRWFVNRYYGGLRAHLARKAGCDRSYISHVLNGTGNVRLTESLAARLGFAGVSLGWLYTGQGSPTWKMSRRNLSGSPALLKEYESAEARELRPD